MCNINSDIGTKCQLYFEFRFRPKVAWKCHRKYHYARCAIILCKIVEMVNLCNTYFACVIPINLFYMFDKIKKHIVWWTNSFWSTRSIGAYQQVCIILSHSSKSGTIRSLTSLGKIAISPACNIQIGWNKRHLKVKTSFVTLIYV